MRNARRKNWAGRCCLALSATGEIWVDGRKLSPERSQEVVNHSPTGFSWGYGGSGPSQLALTLMLEFFPKGKALQIHQDFKRKFIAALPQEDFETTIDLETRSGDLYCDGMFLNAVIAIS